MFIILIISLIITITYCVLVGVSIVGFNKIKENNTIVKIEDKYISIVIAVRNEELNIKQCLASLLNQTYSKSQYEIIVVNDHSDDSTLSILNEYKEENIKVLSLPEGRNSKKEALKFGINKARYAIIATTDGDCILPTNWLQTIANNIEEGTDMLLGPVAFNYKKGFLNAFQQLDMIAMQAFEFGLLAFNKPVLNNGANLSFTKNSYLNVDGYDNYKTPSGDDIFLLEKFKQQDLGIRGVLDSCFIVETSSTTTVKEFMNQRLRWASKSKFFKGNFLQFLSITILLQNLVQLFIYSQVVFIEKFTYIYVILLLSKWLIDFILLFLVAIFFKRSKALLYFIPVQLIYPFYIMVVGFSSFFMKFEWKGRKY